MDPIQLEIIFKIVGALFGMAVAVTAPAIAFFRYNTQRLEKTQAKMVETIKNSTNESVQGLQKDVKSMQTNIENRITDFHKVMDTRTTELKDHFDSELKSVREGMAKSDHEIKLLNDTLNDRDRSIRQRIHENEKELLQFRLDASETFVKKGS